MLNVQSSPAAVDVAATAKRQRPVVSDRRTEDDLKSGAYEYITEDSKSCSPIRLCYCTMSEIFLIIITCNMLSTIGSVTSSETPLDSSVLFYILVFLLLLHRVCKVQACLNMLLQVIDHRTSQSPKCCLVLAKYCFTLMWKVVVHPWHGNIENKELLMDCVSCRCRSPFLLSMIW